jgi:hypothetical protein
MARFDDWVTDPAVTRAGVEEFVADLDNLGADFLGRYVVFTTSGSTGVPALLVQDRRALAVMNGVTYVRALGYLTPRLLAQMLSVASESQTARVMGSGAIPLPFVTPVCGEPSGLAPGTVGCDG